MRFFTDSKGNFSWAAVGGICAALGSLMALFAFFGLSPGGSTEPAKAANVAMVFGDQFQGDKIVGISLAQYEEGLQRRETEIRRQLEAGDDLTAADVGALRATLERIEARQSDLAGAHKDVQALTEELRKFKGAADADKVDKAIAEIFNGDTVAAVRSTIDAGIPVDNIATIQEITGVFQPVETQTDFQSFVAGSDLENNDRYVISVNRDGSVEGSAMGFALPFLKGSWIWRDRKMCWEYEIGDTYYDEHCMNVFASNTAVKLVDPQGKSRIWQRH